MAQRLGHRLTLDDFWDLEPTGVEANTSESVEDFCNKLGIRLDRPRHKRIFDAMIEEASQALTLALRSSTTSCGDHPRKDRTLNIADESTLDHCRRSIYASSRETRKIYEVFQNSAGNSWVLDWALAHASSLISADRTGSRDHTSSPYVSLEQNQAESTTPSNSSSGRQWREVVLGSNDQGGICELSTDDTTIPTSHAV